MRYRKTIITAAILCAAIVATPSYAIFDSAAIVPAIMESTTAITASIGTATTTMMQEMLRIENLLSANSAKVAAQMAEVGQNQVERGLDLARNKDALEIERSTRMPLDPCANASRGLGNPNMDRFNPGFSGGGGAPFGPRGMGTSRPQTGSTSLEKAIAISRNDEFAPAPEVQAIFAQKGACEAYASGKVRTAECGYSGASTNLTSGLPNADIQATSIFDGAQTTADHGKVSLSFSEKQLAAAGAYLRNLSNPVQLRDLTQVEARTDEGRRFLALKDSYQARLDLAMRPLEEFVSNRTKHQGTIEILKAMVDGGGAASKYLGRHLPDSAPDWKAKGISLHQLAYIDAARRYDNPDWIKEISGTSDAATLQREQLMISAQLASLQTKTWIEAQKTNVLLGAIYQASLNKDFMPELAAQHKRAISSR